jgi:phosphoglycolate phosphatase-like HAD superfamily hydrolase
MSLNAEETAVTKQNASLDRHPAVLMMGLVDDLVQVMQDEIPAMEERQHERHQELIRRKQRLTLDYEANLKNMVAEPELLRNLSPELKEKLKTSGIRLAVATEENAKAIKIASQATQRLIQAIIGAMREEAMPKGAYSNPTAMMGMMVPQKCPPVAINQKV